MELIYLKSDNKMDSFLVTLGNLCISEVIMVQTNSGYALICSVRGHGSGRSRGENVSCCLSFAASLQ
uniref:Uncharacterized protein n=1 Tax=Arundo donax TaxID=35708 RepID=A0A0A9DTK6_ARUDO